MKSKYHVYGVICYFFAMAITFGLPNENETSASPALVEKTITWQLHWDKWANIPSKNVLNLTFTTNDTQEVMVRELNWIIKFTSESGQPFPHYVQRLDIIPDEVKNRALASFTNSVTRKIAPSSYTNNFRRISTVIGIKREKLLAAFKEKACGVDMLDFYKDANGKPIKQLRFWIAPAELDFPVKLYFLEGSPYIGKVFFDTQSMKPLYIDFDYIGDAGTGTHDEGLNIMKGIRQEGDQFELKNSELVQVKDHP